MFTEPTEGFEIAGVDLPDGVAALPASARAALVLDVMHAAETVFRRTAATLRWHGSTTVQIDPDESRISPRSRPCPG